MACEVPGRPCEDGENAAMCVANALRDVRIIARDVQYLNAQGNSTPLRDQAEISAIKHAPGDLAKNLTVNSTRCTPGPTLTHCPVHPEGLPCPKRSKPSPSP